MKNTLRNLSILVLAALGTASAGSTSDTQTVTFNMNKIQVLALDTANVDFSWANADWTAGTATNTKQASAGSVLFTANVASKITATATALPNYIDSLNLSYAGGGYAALGTPFNISAGTSSDFLGGISLAYEATANLNTPAAFNAPSVVTVTYTISDQ